MYLIFLLYSKVVHDHLMNCNSSHMIILKCN